MNYEAVLEVKNEQDIKFNVGLSFDRKDPSKSTVKFYDSRYDFTELGQDTGASYYVETLLERVYGEGGLQLWADIPEWYIDETPYQKFLVALQEEIEEWIFAANEDAAEARLES